MRWRTEAEAQRQDLGRRKEVRRGVGPWWNLKLGMVVLAASMAQGTPVTGENKGVEKRRRRKEGRRRAEARGTAGWWLTGARTGRGVRVPAASLGRQREEAWDGTRPRAGGVHLGQQGEAQEGTMDELLLLLADGRRGTRAPRCRGARNREDGARGREDPGGGMVGVGQRRSSSPLGLMRQGGGFGGGWLVDREEAAGLVRSRKRGRWVALWMDGFDGWRQDLR